MSVTDLFRTGPILFKTPEFSEAEYVFNNRPPSTNGNILLSPAEPDAELHQLCWALGSRGEPRVRDSSVHDGDRLTRGKPLPRDTDLHNLPIDNDVRIRGRRYGDAPRTEKTAPVLARGGGSLS